MEEQKARQLLMTVARTLLLCDLQIHWGYPNLALEKEDMPKLFEAFHRFVESEKAKIKTASSRFRHLLVDSLRYMSWPAVSQF